MSVHVHYGHIFFNMWLGDYRCVTCEYTGLTAHTHGAHVRFLVSYETGVMQDVTTGGLGNATRALDITFHFL